MKREELQKRLETENVEFRGNCHDCEVKVNVLCAVNENGELKISGGAIYNPKVGTPPTEQTFFKCDACYQKDKILRNFAPCEVYSRVVGYLRPIQQWNKGKLAEYEQRKEFVTKDVNK